MSDEERKYTETEVRKRERKAFRDGARYQHEVYPWELSQHRTLRFSVAELAEEARRRYPITWKVLRKPTGLLAGMDWTDDGALAWPNPPFQPYRIDADLARALVEFFADPHEEVEG